MDICPQTPVPRRERLREEKCELKGHPFFLPTEVQPKLRRVLGSKDGNFKK